MLLETPAGIKTHAANRTEGEGCALILGPATWPLSLASGERLCLPAEAGLSGHSCPLRSPVPAWDACPGWDPEENLGPSQCQSLGDGTGEMDV